MSDSNIDKVQDDVLQFMYGYFRNHPRNPWLVSHAIAQNVNREYGHGLADVEEAVVRLVGTRKIDQRAETNTIKGYAFGNSTVPSSKVRVVRYRISEKGMQEVNPSKVKSEGGDLTTSASVEQAPEATYITEDYVSSKVIEALKTNSRGWNLKKLLRLISELNDCYRRGNAYSTQMLIRAIVDHIPPMLGKKDFAEVVNGYKWPETEKKYMGSLLNLKAVADDALHRQVSNIPDLIEMADIPPRQGINRLLQECAVVAVTPEDYHKTRIKTPVAKVKATPSHPKLTLKDHKALWANWGAAAPGYRVQFEVDNYGGKEDYIRDVKFEGRTPDGDPWQTTHIFYVPQDRRAHVMHIPENRIFDMSIIVSQQPNLTMGVQPPVLESATMTITYASGGQDEFLFPKDQIGRT